MGPTDNIKIPYDLHFVPDEGTYQSIIVGQATRVFFGGALTTKTFLNVVDGLGSATAWAGRILP
jgi:hypothetical protein